MNQIEALFKTNVPRIVAIVIAFFGALQIAALKGPLTQADYAAACGAAIFAGINWKKHDPSKGDAKL